MSLHVGSSVRYYSEGETNQGPIPSLIVKDNGNGTYNIAYCDYDSSHVDANGNRLMVIKVNQVLTSSLSISTTPNEAIFVIPS